MSEAKEKITDTELEVMQVLWETEAPMTLAQIKAALSGRNGDTIKTLLRRLCQKGAVGEKQVAHQRVFPGGPHVFRIKGGLRVTLDAF